MDRVLDRLWIGSHRDVDSGLPLRSLGFSGVVDLRDGIPARTGEVDVFRIPNRDGDPWSEAQVEDVFRFISERVREGRVLIACAAGMSRSASIVVGYLVRCGWDPASAVMFVAKVRPEIRPVQVMMDSVLRVAMPKGRI